MWKGSIWGAGFRIPFLRFTHCETSSLLPQSGSSSRALGGSRSQKQIGTCHGQIQMPLKPLFILVFQKVKKNKQALFAKSTRAPQVVVTTSYPSELGILRTSVSKCNEKRIVCFLPSFPEDLRVSLPLCFVFPFSLGRLSTAILIQLCRSGTTQSNSFSHPEQPGTSFPPPSPAPAIWAWASVPCTIHSRRRRWRYKASFLFHSRFLVNFPVCTSRRRCNALSPCH